MGGLLSASVTNLSEGFAGIAPLLGLLACWLAGFCAVPKSARPIEFVASLDEKTGKETAREWESACLDAGANSERAGAGWSD